MKDILIHISAGSNQVLYAKYLMENMRRTAKHPGSLAFLMYCTDKVAKWQLDDLEPSRRSRGPLVCSTNLIDVAGLDPRWIHPVAIDAMLDRVSRGPKNVINLICDSDLAMLQPGWDETTRETLLVVDHFGNEYPRFSAGHQPYLGNPSFCWSALAPGYQPNYRLTPSLDFGDMPIITQEQSDTYGIPIGGVLYKECGWSYPNHIRQFKVKTYAMPESFDDAIFPPPGELTKSGQPWRQPIHMAPMTGAPFMAHQGGSRSTPFLAGHSRRFYDAVEKYLGTTMKKNTGKL